MLLEELACTEFDFQIYALRWLKTVSKCFKCCYYEGVYINMS